jgi:hypothetical protein
MWLCVVIKYCDASTIFAKYILAIFSTVARDRAVRFLAIDSFQLDL